MNKKGNLYVIGILSLIILVGALVFFNQRECSKNADCQNNAYCGSDYECHAYPEQIVMKQNNFFPAAVFLGVSLIISVYIYTKRKN